jgi:hypothetical protein
MFHPVYTREADPQVRRAEFRRLFALAIRKIADHAVTKQERSVCAEAIKGRSLSIDGLDILLDIAARAEKPFALEQFIGGQVIQRMAGVPSLCVTTTFLNETRAQARGDIDRSHFHVERTPVRRDQAADALGLHKMALEQDITALLRWDYKDWGFSAPTNGRRQ